MAFFLRTKKKTDKVKTEKKAVAPVTSASASVAHILLNPRITEKATMLGVGSVYVFDVATDANKSQVASAIRAAYKVTPRMVRLVNVRAKNVRNMRTGKRGVKQGGKKAYVYLKKGETITVA